MEDYTYIEQKKAHLALCVFDQKGDYPGGIDMDQYTYIEVDKAKTKRCVHPWAEYALGYFTHCEGEGRKWKTVKAIPWLLDVFAPSRGMYSQVGRKLSEMSQRMGYLVHEVEDSAYGTVKA